MLSEKKYLVTLFTILILCTLILVLYNPKDAEQYSNIAILNTTKNPIPNGLDIGSPSTNELGKIIFDLYDRYDSFIIITGKDDLNYIASALSFMLENIGKTIVITPFYSDRLRKIIGMYRIPEVCIYDGETISRGNKKEICIYDENKLYKERILAQPTEPLKLLPFDMNKKIVIFKMFPGADSKYLYDMLKDNKISAVVLEGGSMVDSKFTNFLQNISQRGIFIVNVGNEEIPNTITSTLSVESTLSKLHLILSHVEKVNSEMLKELMKLSMRGE